MNRIAFSLTAVLCPLASLTAQNPEPPPPLPPPPFLAAIPSGTLWRMEMEVADKNKNQKTPEGQPMPTTVISRESIKSETVRRDVFTIAPSAKNVRWMASGYLLIGTEDPQNIVIFSEDAANRTDWLAQLDYSELSWVGPSTLVGWENPGKSPNLVFEGKIPIRADGLASTSLALTTTTSPTGSPLPTTQVRAVINSETKRPVSYFDGLNTYNYSFESGKAMPSLPEEFRVRLESYLRRKQSMY